MDFNQAIYQALIKEAQSYFSEISSKFPAGTYTSKQVKELMVEHGVLHEVKVEHKYNNFDTKDKFYLKSDYDSVKDNYIVTVLNSGKMINIEVGGFRTSFDACKVFDYLEKFRRVCGEKSKLTFTVAEKVESAMEFQFELKKEYKNLLKYVAEDELRPVMHYVNLDVENQELVAFDGHKLAIYPVEIKNLKKDYKDYSHINLQLPTEIFKKCIGTVTVSVSKDLKKVTVADCEGKVYIQDSKGRFPNYRYVLLKMIKHAYVDLTKDSIKEMKSFLKMIIKAYKYPIAVNFFFEEGASSLVVSYKDVDQKTVFKRSFQLAEKCRFTQNIMFACNHLADVLNSSWNGRIWVKGSNYAAYFDGLHNNISLLMPVMLEPEIRNYDTIKGAEIDVYNRPGGFMPEKLDLGKGVTSQNMSQDETDVPVLVSDAEPIESTDEVKENPVPSVEKIGTVEASPVESGTASAPDSTVRPSCNTDTVSGAGPSPWIPENVKPDGYGCRLPVHRIFAARFISSVSRSLQRPAGCGGAKTIYSAMFFSMETKQYHSIQDNFIKIRGTP